MNIDKYIIINQIPVRYTLRDSEGNIINTIIAEESFIQENYQGYEYEAELVTPLQENPELSQLARNVRDKKLKETDQLVLISDHSDIEAIKEYRKRLRDWPETDAFPLNIPELKDVIEELKNNIQMDILSN